MSTRLLVSAILSASVTAVALAQAPALNVKMGLWEVTTVSNVGGQMPTIDTSKMTPEQKARMDAAMQSMMGTHTNVVKSCMTKDKFDKSNFMTPDQPGQTCKQTITTNTSSTLDAAVTCTGTTPMTIQTHLQASSSTSFAGTMKSNITEQGRTMSVAGTMSGKWLGADCGDVK